MRHHISVGSCLTVAELREVLNTANEDAAVHLVDARNGDVISIKAAMFNMNNDAGDIMLFTEVI